MVWENAVYTNGNILYAESLDVLQNNILALAAQDSGAPKIDVSCLAASGIDVTSLDAEYIITSDFRCDIGSVNNLDVASTATVEDLVVNGAFSPATIVTTDFAAAVGSLDDLNVASGFSMNSGDINALAVNSYMNYIGKPFYACRAWATFDGATPLTIHASGNVSSITRVAAGIYIVNFNTNFIDADYAVLGSSSDDVSVSTVVMTDADSIATNACAIIQRNRESVLVDRDHTTVLFLR